MYTHQHETGDGYYYPGSGLGSRDRFWLCQGAKSRVLIFKRENIFRLFSLKPYKLYIKYNMVIMEHQPIRILNILERLKEWKNVQFNLFFSKKDQKGKF